MGAYAIRNLNLMILPSISTGKRVEQLFRRILFFRTYSEPISQTNVFCWDLYSKWKLREAKTERVFDFQKWYVIIVWESV